MQGKPYLKLLSAQPSESRFFSSPARVSALALRPRPTPGMPPKRRGGAADTSKGAKRAKPAAKDTVGIPELFKKVKSDLTPDAKGQKPESQEPAPSPVVEDVAEPAPSTLTEPSTSAEPVATPPTPLTSEEDSLLRSFDLCEAYGPSLGLSRKERWQRAEGASPPGLHSAPRQRISSNRPLARACDWQNADWSRLRACGRSSRGWRTTRPTRGRCSRDTTSSRVHEGLAGRG